jgi:hypothetical protein
MSSSLPPPSPPAPASTRSRLRVERLELDMRGIAPATAQAAAEGLGAALGRALAGGAAPAIRPAPARHLDAGRIASPAAPDPDGLAARIAQRIVGSVRRGQP